MLGAPHPRTLRRRRQILEDPALAAAGRLASVAWAVPASLVIAAPERVVPQLQVTKGDQG